MKIWVNSYWRIFAGQWDCVGLQKLFSGITLEWYKCSQALSKSAILRSSCNSMPDYLFHCYRLKRPCSFCTELLLTLKPGDSIKMKAMKLTYKMQWRNECWYHLSSYFADPHIKVSGKRNNVKEAKEKIMSVLDTKVSFLVRWAYILRWAYIWRLVSCIFFFTPGWSCWSCLLFGIAMFLWIAFKCLIKKYNTVMNKDDKVYAGWLIKTQVVTHVVVFFVCFFFLTDLSFSVLLCV